jgi:hypothetical protein
LRVMDPPMPKMDARIAIKGDVPGVLTRGLEPC